MNENENINYMEKYSGVYTTTIENENTIPILLDHTAYRNGLDILNVFVNGMFINSSKYVIVDNSIILNEPLHKIGTKIQFDILRSVITTVPFTLLKGDTGGTTTLKRWEVI